MGDDEKAHEPYHTLVLSAGSDETGVKLTAMEDRTEFVLVYTARLLFEWATDSSLPRFLASRWTSQSSNMALSS